MATLPSGSKKPSQKLFVKEDTAMDYQNNIDAGNFERVNNLISHRIALLQELRELQEDDSDEA